MTVRTLNFLLVLFVDFCCLVPAIEEQVEKPQPTPNKPYSIYTKREKWIIVAMAAVAGLFR